MCITPTGEAEINCQLEKFFFLLDLTIIVLESYSFESIYIIHLLCLVSNVFVFSGYLGIVYKELLVRIFSQYAS